MVSTLGFNVQQHGEQGAECKCLQFKTFVINQLCTIYWDICRNYIDLLVEETSEMSLLAPLVNIDGGASWYIAKRHLSFYRGRVSDLTSLLIAFI